MLLPSYYAPNYAGIIAKPAWSGQSGYSGQKSRVMRVAGSSSKSGFIILSNIAVTNNTSDCSIREYRYYYFARVAKC